MTEEPRVEEVNCRSMEAFAASQKSFKQGFVRVNGYIMPRRYLQETPPEYEDYRGRIYKEENPGYTRAPCFIPTNSWTSLPHASQLSKCETTTSWLTNTDRKRKFWKNVVGPRIFLYMFFLNDNETVMTINFPCTSELYSGVQVFYRYL